MVMQLMPDSPGLATFFSNLGLNLSPVVIGLILQYCVNPLGHQPTVATIEGKKEIKYFDDPVAKSVPMFFAAIGTYLIVCSVMSL